MTKDEALKLALEALEDLGMKHFENTGEVLYKDTFTAIKEALAQPKSEYERGFIDGMQKQMQSSVDKAVNAMTQPTYYIPNKDERTWVGLTKNEVETLSYIAEGNTWIAIERAEAKLKEKNT
jgi:hypothetical protein